VLPLQGGWDQKYYLKATLRPYLERCVRIFEESGAEALENHIKTQEVDARRIENVIFQVSTTPPFGADFGGSTRKNATAGYRIFKETVLRSLLLFANRGPMRTNTFSLLHGLVHSSSSSIQRKLEDMGYEKEVRHLLTEREGRKFLYHPQVRKSQPLTERGDVNS
jgi:hypothetical protein